jgi:hypothetical protein
MWLAGRASGLGQQNRKQCLDEHAPDIYLGPVPGLATSALLRCVQLVDGRGTHLPLVLVGPVVPNLHETDDDGMGMNN